MLLTKIFIAIIFGGIVSIYDYCEITEVIDDITFDQNDIEFANRYLEQKIMRVDYDLYHYCTDSLNNSKISNTLSSSSIKDKKYVENNTSHDSNISFDISHDENQIINNNTNTNSDIFISELSPIKKHASANENFDLSSDHNVLTMLKCDKYGYIGSPNSKKPVVKDITLLDDVITFVLFYKGKTYSAKYKENGEYNPLSEREKIDLLNRYIKKTIFDELKLSDTSNINKNKDIKNNIEERFMNIFTPPCIVNNQNASDNFLLTEYSGIALSDQLEKVKYKLMQPVDFSKRRFLYSEITDILSLLDKHKISFCDLKSEHIAIGKEFFDNIQLNIFDSLAFNFEKCEITTPRYRPPELQVMRFKDNYIDNMQKTINQKFNFAFKEKNEFLIEKYMREIYNDILKRYMDKYGIKNNDKDSIDWEQLEKNLSTFENVEHYYKDKKLKYAIYLNTQLTVYKNALYQNIIARFAEIEYQIQTSEKYDLYTLGLIIFETELFYQQMYESDNNKHDESEIKDYLGYYYRILDDYAGILEESEEIKDEKSENSLSTNQFLFKLEDLVNVIKWKDRYSKDLLDFIIEKVIVLKDKRVDMKQMALKLNQYEHQII